MRLRNKPGALEKLQSNTTYVVQNPEQFQGSWPSVFVKEQPIHIEIGTGKGRFITELAQKHPEINFIGIELQASVLIHVLEKLETLKLPNVKLLHTDGRAVTQYFAAGEVDRIYLNFSDPWPKKRHEKRRLTSPDFLVAYQEILAPECQIYMKTDNQGLFEYTLVTLSEQGWMLDEVSLDLHRLEDIENVMTEYEEKFSSRGQRIYRLKTHFPKEEC